MIKYASVFLMLVFIVGCCTTTTDPRRGGLFSYCPKSYKERLENREEVISVLERAKEEQQEISHDLEDEARTKRALLAEQQQQLSSMDGELASIQQKIYAYHEQTKTQATEKVRLEGRLRLAKEQVKVLQSGRKNSPQESAVMAGKIQKLRQEIEELLQLTLSLTQRPK